VFRVSCVVRRRDAKFCVSTTDTTDTTNATNTPITPIPTIRGQSNWPLMQKFGIMVPGQ